MEERVNKMPMPQRPRAVPDEQRRDSERALHPAIVEAASFYTNVLEENERLKTDLRTLRSDLDSMRRAADMWRTQAETERAAKEIYLRDRHAQNAELDVIVRTVNAARDRAMQRSGN